MAPVYSVTEVADRIARKHFPGDDVDTVIRQLRHWTEQGALMSLGEPNSGRGRHRQYSEQALYVAIVLLELTRFGIPIAGLKAASKSLHDIRVWSVPTTAQEIHLRLSYELVGDRRARARAELVTRDQAAQLFGKSEFPLSTIEINLTGLFGRLHA
jgi:DNA-binding transcriptional MerR regulator